jgi:hypothetical protein
MKQVRFFGIALLGLFGLTLVNGLVANKANAAVSVYGLSCTNKAYGSQLTAVDETNAGYSSTISNTSGGATTTAQVVYVGTDCLYAGAGKTNSTSIVSGDVALMAANAIVGGINDRINAINTNNTAAHMSYKSDGNGIGFAANRIIGGIGIWANYSDSDFDNDQTFSSRQTDSNAYDSSANSTSFGIDKSFGNMFVGITGNSFDVDANIKANGGTYSADGETVGVYGGLKTSLLTISAGLGSGEYDIKTTRIDLGTGVVGAITGKATADVEYQHAGIIGNMSRGKLSFMPRLNYRNVDIDTPALTDVVANDNNTAGDAAQTTGSGGLALGKNADDIAIAAFSASSSSVEAGLRLVATLGMISPYLDLAYVSEDTTAATYLVEQRTDATGETAATDANGYGSLGIGFNFNVGGRLSGGLSFYSMEGRDDTSASTAMGSIRLQF